MIQKLFSCVHPFLSPSLPFSRTPERHLVARNTHTHKIQNGSTHRCIKLVLGRRALPVYCGHNRPLCLIDPIAASERKQPTRLRLVPGNLNQKELRTNQIKKEKRKTW